MPVVRRFLNLRWILRTVAAAAGACAGYAPAGSSLQTGCAVAAAALAGLSIDLAAPRKGARHKPALPGPGAPLPALWLLLVGLGFHGCAHSTNPQPGEPVAVCPSAANLAKRITGTDVLDVENVVAMGPKEADCHETIHQDQAAAEGASEWARGFISQTFLVGFLGNLYERDALEACAQWH